MAERKRLARKTCSESSLANKAIERARQLEVRSEINGSFKDVVVALLAERIVERDNVIKI